MEEYRFEHREPLTQRVVLALRVNLKQLKERLWLGRKYKVGAWINLYSRSWKRTMLHRSNFKEQKPLSSSSEKKQIQNRELSRRILRTG